MFRILSLALFLTGAALAAHAADVYRYVDAQGGVHYTDTWVPGSTVIHVNHVQKPAEAASPTTHPPQNKTLSASDHAAAELTKQADEQTVHADVAKAQEDACKQAKDNYTKAIASRRIIKSGTGDQREYLSEADADAYRLQLHDNMLAACGPDAK
jgi:opacity protein-like surface antigen